MQRLATRNCIEVELKPNPCTILYFGTSHVRRLGEFLSHIGERNLHYDPKSCHVSYYGISGGTLQKNYICPYKCIFEHMSIIKSCKPDAVIIQVGSNDIDNMDATSIVDNIIQLAEIMIHFGAKLCVICTLWYRRRHDGFNKKINIVNASILARCKPLQKIYVWRHMGFKNPLKGKLTYLNKKGTHLNKKGNYKLYKSLRGSVQLARKMGRF